MQHIIPTILKPARTTGYELIFAMNENFKSAIDLSLDMSEIIGLGGQLERSETAEPKYTRQVKFFDEVDI